MKIWEKQSKQYSALSQMYPSTLNPCGNVSCAHIINRVVDDKKHPLNLLESVTADYDLVKETILI